MVANLKRSGWIWRGLHSRNPARLLLMGALILGLAAPGAFANASRGGSELAPILGASQVAGPKLTGLTRDALGEILAGVEILLAPVDGESAGEPVARVRSDEAGRFRFPSLRPGLYRVIAVKGGYGVVVGQVNTMVQASLDLILFPTGREKADPASTPADAAWALRLPSRDSLEDAELGLGNTLSGGTSVPNEAPARPPLHLSLAHHQLDGSSGGEGSGLKLDLLGALSIGELGNLNLDVDYSRVGRNSGARQDGTLVSLGWIAPGSLGNDTRIDARGSRSEREYARLADDAFFSRVDRYSVAGEQMHARSYGSLLYKVRAESFDAEQIDAASAAALATGAGSLIAASVELGREWSPEHASRVRVEVAHGQDVLLGPSDSEVLLSPASESWSFAALDRIDGSSISLFLEDRRRLGEMLSAFVRASAHALPGRASRDLRSASAVGVAWQPLEGTELRAEFGADWDGDESGSAEVWRVELAHADENWNVTLAHASQTGASAWSDEASIQTPLLVTDHEGRIETWSVETSLSPDGSWWPTLALRGELYSIDGRLAARLEGDTPFVPVAHDARARGHRIELGLNLARLGTLLELSWEGVEDRDGSGELLGGASRLIRRGVNLRQRLGMIEWYGTNCYLLVGIVDQDARVPSLSAELDASRLAFFDLRRVSGGLAVAF